MTYRIGSTPTRRVGRFTLRRQMLSATHRPPEHISHEEKMEAMIPPLRARRS
jgi:hypothetical protein